MIYFNNLHIEQQRYKKLEIIRSERDSLLNSTDWITSYRTKEDIAVNAGYITNENRRWSQEEIMSYLLWCKYLCDLPETIQLDNKIDNLTLEKINKDNLELFPPCPLLNELSSL